MTFDGTVNRFLPIAQEVCSYYDITSVEITPLRQSENLTYRVTRKEDNEHFLLRIHRSKSISTPAYTREMIESELLWLLALSQDISIVVQEPQVNRFGQLVTEITAPDEQSPFYCTLLRWIDGLPLETPCSVLQARNLGELMAQLHNHTCQWQPPPNFIRPGEDLDYLHWNLEHLGNAVVDGLISISDFSLIEDVVRQIEIIVSGLLKTSQTWGLIHGDLNEGNYLFYGDEIRPIDFSGCKYSYFLRDISFALPHLHPDARRSFLLGYEGRRRLPRNYMEFLEAFFMWWWVSNISFHCMDAEEQEYLVSWIPEFLASYGKSFLAGERLRAFWGG